MNVTIVGVFGTRNRGLAALINPIVHYVHNFFDKPAITVMSKSADYDRTTIDSRANVVPDHISGRGGSMISRIADVSTAGLRFLPQRFREAALPLTTADVAIATGGDIFSSDYRSNMRDLIPLQLARSCKVPYVFLAQSIGPFKSKGEANAWKEIAKGSLLITIRESLSYEYVVEELGMDERQVKLTADPAFLLEIPPSPIIDRLLAQYRVAQGIPVIAIAPSAAISHHAERDADRHHHALHTTIQTFLDRTEAHILLIPHVQHATVRGDDRALATALHRSHQYDPRISVVGGEHTAAELKGIISRCSFLVAERLHAGIAGLSSEVPTVVIGFSVKADGIVGDIYRGEKIPVIGIRRLIEETSVPDELFEFWNNRNALRSTLHAKLPEVKLLAVSNFEYLKSYLQSKPNG